MPSLTALLAEVNLYWSPASDGFQPMTGWHPNSARPVSLAPEAYLPNCSAVITWKVDGGEGGFYDRPFFSTATLIVPM